MVDVDANVGEGRAGSTFKPFDLYRDLEQIRDALLTAAVEWRLDKNKDQQTREAVDGLFGIGEPDAFGYYFLLYPVDGREILEDYLILWLSRQENALYLFDHAEKILAGDRGKLSDHKVKKLYKRMRKWAELKVISGVLDEKLKPPGEKFPRWVFGNPALHSTEFMRAAKIFLLRLYRESGRDQFERTCKMCGEGLKASWRICPKCETSVE